jgi:hypothetical protein
MSRSVSRALAAASLLALAVTTPAVGRRATAQPPAPAPRPAGAAAAKPTKPINRYNPHSGFVHFTTEAMPPQADAVGVIVNLELWWGKQAPPVRGDGTIGLEVKVYPPGDPKVALAGLPVAGFAGPRMRVVPSDVPYRERVPVVIPVPPSPEPYNVVVQVVSSPVKGGIPSLMSAADERKLPRDEFRPNVFSAKRFTVSTAW